MTDELAKARLKRDRDRLAKAQRWTPQEAIEAALADIKLGDLEEVEALTVVVACRALNDDGEASTYVQRYTGSNGATGPKETFWIIGMLNKCIKDWLS